EGEKRYVELKGVDCSIISPATLIGEIDSIANIDEVAKHSHIVILDTALENEKLIVLSNGKVIGLFDEVMKAIGLKIIPAFYIKDIEVAKIIAQYMTANKIYDAYFISNNIEILKQTVALQKFARRVLDMSGNTKATVDEIVFATNESEAKIVIVNELLSKKRFIDDIRSAFMTVWTKVENYEKHSALSLILEGTQGIVSDYSEEFSKLMTSYFKDTTLLRKIFLIGHRGVPTKAVENTMSGYRKAIEYGADMIETDIQMTKDGKLVIMHNSTVDGLMNGSGQISQMTLAELKQLRFVNSPNESIPTFEEFLKEFKGQNVKLVVEIKAAMEGIEKVMAEMIMKNDMMSQCVIIAFNGAQLVKLRSVCPQLSVGLLGSDIRIKTNKVLDVDKSLMRLYAVINQNNFSYNANNTHLSNSVTNQAILRGVSQWPYTYNAIEPINRHMLLGVSGFTTDIVYAFSDKVQEINLSKNEVDAQVGKMIDLKVIGTTFDNHKIDMNSEAVIVSGDCIEIQNGKAIATAKGEAYIMYRTKIVEDGFSEYYMYTNIAKINVIYDKEDKPTPKPDDNTGCNCNKKDNSVSQIGWGLLICAGVYLSLRLRKV
ncbi:MAG: glycerophosphodiester phosphodiesterase, partial [Clostridia bacterium]